MPHINEKTCLALSLIWSLVHTPSLFASENTAASIVKFQQTLAAKGHATAQYRLGMMYETGTGVVQDLATARTWYQQSAGQAFTPASHRLIYLDLVRHQARADQDWLKQLHRDADSGNGEAMLLLGQLYAQGTGVTADLTLAANYLRQARAQNIPGSDAELSRVDDTIKQQNADALAAEKRQAEQAARMAQQQADTRRAQQQRDQLVAQQKKKAELQQLHLQQTRLAQSATKPASLSGTQALADRKTALPTPPPGAVTEMDMSPCSGRNRFASTCR